MTIFNINDYPHRRLNPLTGEYVLVSPHRTRRPWQGKQERVSGNERPIYDPTCYLCPGNVRANGEQNPSYSSTYVFTNDFAALLPEAHESPSLSDPLFYTQGVQGTCRVICFSPHHNLTLAEMSLDEIRNVVNIWAQQTEELGKNYEWVQIFENKGEAMGSSNPHPHGQIWAGNWLPNEIAKEDYHQREYYGEYGSPMLVDYVAQELQQGVRIVAQNDSWIAVVPYWAIWPFETLLIPQRHILRLPDLTGKDRNALADILKRLLTKYDNLFEVSFPYSMGWHGAPTGNKEYDGWQLHAHFYPPLLRSATVKKFMVGYEMMAEAQRDITAEQAAKRLKEVSEAHYLTA